MKTSQRFESAIKKLYRAFHNDELHPECCKQCAVGNILDHSDAWKHLSDDHGSTKLNYVGQVHQRLGRRFNGYTPYELLQIESRFLRACNYQLPLRHGHFKPEDPKDKSILFDGLCEVVGFLCELDGIPNVMDYTKLFEVENDQPKYEYIK
ncbi:Na(+)-translocating NADH-quinone reductase subunit F [Psychroserpens sp. XS_ASV72]|uniref:Na(+)-translocating NADH-quinone reductase subunit F n=1 Tax=Psychroserpens sp. XS_ASV72 TaxID=3241293 RepID=UPI003518B82E